MRIVVSEDVVVRALPASDILAHRDRLKVVHEVLDWDVVFTIVKGRVIGLSQQLVVPLGRGVGPGAKVVLLAPRVPHLDKSHLD